MSLRKPADQSLSVRQKLTLFHASAMTAEQALTTKDDQITFDLMMTNGVKALNIATAGLRPLALKAHRVDNAQQLRRLGFDALHLVDPVWCQEANAAYGAADVISAFLQTPSDAVALAGSDAIDTLGVSVQQLLEACAGAPMEGLSVLQQVTVSNPLRGLEARVLLDTGLRGPQLKQLGYGITSAREMLGVGPAEMKKLGFQL